MRVISGVNHGYVPRPKLREAEEAPPGVGCAMDRLNFSPQWQLYWIEKGNSSTKKAVNYARCPKKRATNQKNHNNDNGNDKIRIQILQEYLIKF